MDKIINCPDCNEHGKFYSVLKQTWLECAICKGQKKLKLRVIDFGGDKVEIWVPANDKFECEE